MSSKESGEKAVVSRTPDVQDAAIPLAPSVRRDELLRKVALAGCLGLMVGSVPLALSMPLVWGGVLVGWLGTVLLLLGRRATTTLSPATHAAVKALLGRLAERLGVHQLDPLSPSQLALVAGQEWKHGRDLYFSFEKGSDGGFCWMLVVKSTLPHIAPKLAMAFPEHWPFHRHHGTLKDCSSLPQTLLTREEGLTWDNCHSKLLSQTQANHPYRPLQRRMDRWGWQFFVTTTPVYHERKRAPFAPEVVCYSSHAPSTCTLDELEAELDCLLSTILLMEREPKANEPQLRPDDWAFGALELLPFHLAVALAGEHREDPEGDYPIGWLLRFFPEEPVTLARILQCQKKQRRMKLWEWLAANWYRTLFQRTTQMEILPVPTKRAISFTPVPPLFDLLVGSPNKTDFWHEVREECLAHDEDSVRWYGLVWSEPFSLRDVMELYTSARVPATDLLFLDARLPLLSEMEQTQLFAALRESYEGALVALDPTKTKHILSQEEALGLCVTQYLMAGCRWVKEEERFSVISGIFKGPKGKPAVYHKPNEMICMVGAMQAFCRMGAVQAVALLQNYQSVFFHSSLRRAAKDAIHTIKQHASTMGHERGQLSVSPLEQTGALSVSQSLPVGSLSHVPNSPKQHHRAEPTNEL